MLEENISAAKKKCKSKKEDVDLLKEDVKRHCEKVVSAWEEYIRSNESLKNQVLDIQKEVCRFEISFLNL